MTKWVAAAVVLVGLVLSACSEGAMQVAGGPSTGRTTEERALEQQVRSLNQVSRDIVVRNTVQGIGAGAVGGCVAGLLLGGDEQDCLRYGLAGAAVGGVAGNAVGRRAASVNEELVRQDAIIANLRGVNQQLGSVRSNLSQVVSSQNAEIGSLRRQLANEQISQRAYQARVQAINANRATVINGLAESERNVATSRAELVSIQQQTGQPLSQSTREAAATQQRIATIRNSISLVPTN